MCFGKARIFRKEQAINGAPVIVNDRPPLGCGVAGYDSRDDHRVLRRCCHSSETHRTPTKPRVVVHVQYEGVNPVLRTEKIAQSPFPHKGEIRNLIPHPHLGPPFERKPRNKNILSNSYPRKIGVQVGRRMRQGPATGKNCNITPWPTYPDNNNLKIVPIMFHPYR